MERQAEGAKSVATRATSAGPLTLSLAGQDRDDVGVRCAVRSRGAGSKVGRWTLGHGEMHVINDTGMNVSISFSSMEDRQMIERPVDLVARPRDPQTMRLGELRRFIRAVGR